MTKAFTIVHITDKPSAKSRAAKVLFPELPAGKWKIEAHNAKQRSTQQNKFYWGVCVAMVKDGMNELGHELTAEETHEFLKSRFNSKEVVNTETGECIQIPLSTTRLMTVGFMEYVEKIQRFSAEWLNINIPDPGQQLDIDYEVAVASYDKNLSATIIEK